MASALQVELHEVNEQSEDVCSTIQNTIQYKNIFTDMWNRPIDFIYVPKLPLWQLLFTFNKSDSLFMPQHILNPQYVYSRSYLRAQNIYHVLAGHLQYFYA